MTPHQRIEHTSRRTRRTLTIVVAFYVVVGFILAGPAAVEGDRLSTFLGFLIISAALGAAVILRATLRLGVRISEIGESLEQIRTQLTHDNSRDFRNDEHPTTPAAGAEAVIDLLKGQSHDPDRLTAATLDRDVYPRLVTVMHGASVVDRDGSSQAHGVTGSASGHSVAEESEDYGVAESNLAVRNLIRVWRVALRDGNFEYCMKLLSTMADVADPRFIDRLRHQLQPLADRFERESREEFSRHIHSQDFAKALNLGKRIAALLPDRRVARDFLRVEPHIRRRAQ